MAFKMKGSPMLRNYGVGSAAAKAANKKADKKSTKSSVEALTDHLEEYDPKHGKNYTPVEGLMDTLDRKPTVRKE
jgi:hypothetical protein